MRTAITVFAYLVVDFMHSELKMRPLLVFMMLRHILTWYSLCVFLKNILHIFLFFLFFCELFYGCGYGSKEEERVNEVDKRLIQQRYIVKKVMLDFLMS